MIEKYVPYKNVGMRRKQRKQAKGTKKGAAPFSRFIGDVNVKLEMKYRSHYLFGKLSKNIFPAPVELSWDMHLDTKPADNGLMVLAKTDQGNMILESGNIVAVRFGIDKRHPEALSLLDAFVGEMHANMVTDEHLDLCSVLAYRDEAKPLKLKAKAGLKLSRAQRPVSAPVGRRNEKVGVPRHIWSEQVTDAVRQVGIVSDTNGSTFRAIAKEPIIAFSLDEKAAIQKKKEMFEASAAGGDSKAGSSRSGLRSATSRGTYLPSAGPSRPASGKTAPTVQGRGGGPKSRQVSAVSGRSDALPPSFRPMSAVNREKLARKNRPFSAVSAITEGTYGTKDEYEAILVDDDDEHSFDGDSEVAGSEYTTATQASHPASHLAGRSKKGVAGVRICGEMKPKRPFSGYKRVLAAQRKSAGTSHISVVNSGIYRSRHELEQIEFAEGKKKWMSQKNIDTTMTHTRLKPSNAACGRKKTGGWDDVPEFVQVHAGPWKEGNYAATYKFRELPPHEQDQAPFHLVTRKESTLYKPMGNQWDELDAVETKIDEKEYARWEQASQSEGTRAA
jgi:hypothetical protein